MPKELFRLPNGEVTTDISVYGKAWNDFAEPICKLLGARLDGMDPGIMVWFNKRAVRFDVDVLEKLYEKLGIKV